MGLTEKRIVNIVFAKFDSISGIKIEDRMIERFHLYSLMEWYPVIPTNGYLIDDSHQLTSCSLSIDIMLPSIDIIPPNNFILPSNNKQLKDFLTILST